MTHPLTPREKVELKPCPFCGGEAWLNDYEAKYSDLPPKSRCPQCRSCRASLGYLTTPAKATEAWNRRTALASGSGDHSGGVTDMIGSGNHEELARLAEAVVSAERGTDIQAMADADQAFHECLSAATVLALLAENAALRSDNAALREHRIAADLLASTLKADKAEAARKLAEAEGLLREASSELESEVDARYDGVKDHPAMTPKYERDMDTPQRINAWLSKEAERG